MVLRRNKEEPNGTQPKRSTLATVKSMSSGLAHDADTVRERLDRLANFNEYNVGIKTFEVECTRVDDSVAPYKSIITLSPRGASLPVDTVISRKVAKPDRLKGIFEEVAGCAVIHSSDPDFLIETFLRKPKDDVESSAEDRKDTKKNIEENLVVIAAHYRDDRGHKDAKTGEQYIETSWVDAAVKQHAFNSRKFIKRHGSTIKKTGGFTRSSSSVFWLEEHQDHPEKYTVHFYCNPEHGKERLFLDKLALNNRFIKSLLKLASIPLNTEPYSKAQAYELINQVFPRVARDIKFGLDPYDLFTPERDSDKWYRNIGTFYHALGKYTLRSTQSIANTLVHMNLITAGAVIGSSVLLYSISKIPFLVLAGGGVVGAAKGGALSRGVIGFGRACAKGCRKILSRGRSANTVNIGKDVTERLQAQNERTASLPSELGKPLNYHVVESTTAANIEVIRNSAPNAPAFTAQDRLDWATSVLLNPFSAEDGINTSEVLLEAIDELNGEEYFLVRQTDGIDSYFHPRGLMSLSIKSRDAQPHSRTPGPIQDLFDQMPEDHNILGVRHCANGKREVKYFVSLEDVPADFLGCGSISLEEFERINGYEVGQQWTPKKTYQITDNVSFKEAEKIKKRAKKDLKTIVKTTTKLGTDLSLEFKERRDSYCEPGSKGFPYQDDRSTLYLMPEDMPSFDDKIPHLALH